MQKRIYSVLLIIFSIFFLCACDSKDDIIPDNNEAVVTKKIQASLQVKSFRKINLSEKLKIINLVSNNPEKYGFKKQQRTTKSSIENDFIIYERGNWKIFQSKKIHESLNESKKINYEWYLDGSLNICSRVVLDGQKYQTVRDTDEGTEFYKICMKSVRNYTVFSPTYVTIKGRHYISGEHIFTESDRLGDLERAEKDDPTGGISRHNGPINIKP